MQIYNTMDRRKEELIPVEPGKIRMYVCGITAYDYSHIGHARAAVVFDVLARHLKNLGNDVYFIQNFTDIDDKIINRANKENRDWREIGQTYIDAYHEDMGRLDVEKPQLEPRATEYIPQIREIISKLINKGLAYSTPEGSVYFRTRAWPNYGKLSGRNLDELLAGARIQPGEEKEDPLDFALWKTSKPGEPVWDSPWGKGRPGWHVECSAMTAPWLPLDIHGGGLDLTFPHHENEIAQSEAALGKEVAHYWVHNGFVRIESEKMSKSLGNFKTVRDILEDWLPETLRFFLLTRHYRSPIDFTMQAMQEAEKGEQRVYTALLEAEKNFDRANWKNTKIPQTIIKEWEELPIKFQEALDDDLNTAAAIGYIFANVKIINQLLENKNFRISCEAKNIFEEFLKRAQIWQKEMGLFGQNPQTFLNELREIRIKRNKIDKGKVEDLLNKRKEARIAKDFALSDNLRNELEALGIICKDTPAGQIWDVQTVD